MIPRLLTICHSHPALMPGGTEHVAHDLFRAYHRAGGDAWFLGCVTQLSRPFGPAQALEGINGAENELLLRVKHYDHFLGTQVDSAATYAAFGKLLREIMPDVIHFHHFSLIGVDALIVARRALPQARIVASLHDYQLICANDGLMVRSNDGSLCSRATPDGCHGCRPDFAPSQHRLREIHIKNLLGLVDAFIAPSEFAAERFAQWGLPRAAISVLPNPVATEPLPARRSDAYPTFGYFGNMAPHKGVSLLLQAFGRLLKDVPQARLYLHGGAVAAHAGFFTGIKAEVDALGGQAVALGAYGRDELPQLMQRIDWTVVPSLWWENQPLAILESFRCGRPVIAADIGGMAELVRHEENGLRFRARDPLALKDAMLRAAGDAELHRRLSQTLPEVEDAGRSAERHLELYRQLCVTREALPA